VTDTPPKVYYDGTPREPYDEAARRHERQHGNVYREKAWWQLATALMAVAVVLSAGSHLVAARRPSHEPVYIRVNQDAQLQVLNWDQYIPEDEEVKADLLVWVRCWRGIPTSREVLERCWQRVPMFLMKNTHAYGMVAKYFAQVSPDGQLWNKGVEVREMEGFKEPDGRWRVTWVEDIYALQRGGPGRLESSTRHTAILIVERRKPTTRAQIALDGEPVNPRGIYITAMTWSH
jgi:type IV secretory pathway TrbF-like protein